MYLRMHDLTFFLILEKRYIKYLKYYSNRHTTLLLITELRYIRGQQPLYLARARSSGTLYMVYIYSVWYMYIQWYSGTHASMCVAKKKVFHCNDTMQQRVSDDSEIRLNSSSASFEGRCKVRADQNVAVYRRWSLCDGRRLRLCRLCRRRSKRKHGTILISLSMIMPVVSSLCTVN